MNDATQSTEKCPQPGFRRARFEVSAVAAQITNNLILEIQEFLLAAGWCLFCVSSRVEVTPLNLGDAKLCE
jgi:hypothetical protein